MISMHTDIVVVGGGISGLCVAHWLHKRGRSVVVLEKDATVGGTMKTLHEEGFLIETGPNSALETTPLFRELVTDLQLENEWRYANPVGQNRYVLRNGELHAIPLNPLTFLRTPLFSASAKLRLLKEPFIGRAEKEESIAEFVTRRLGREFLDYAIDPFVAGVYAARPEHLSVRAAFPKLYALEAKYGGLIRGMIKGRKERKERSEKAKDRAQTFSFARGMQQLPLALARNLGDAVVTHAEVDGIRKEPSEPESVVALPQFAVSYVRHGSRATIRCTGVVLSVPAFAAAPLVRPFSSEMASVLESIHYPPVASVFMGLRAEDVGQELDGFGFLVPSVEGRKILGCLWSSSLFEGRAPRGMVALTTFVGGSRQPELALKDEEGLCSLALEELRPLMHISGNPVYWKATRWQKAIPQYELGYGEKLKTMDEFEEAHRGIYFCSNYRGGIAVGDCVMSSATIARKILQQPGVTRNITESASRSITT